MATGKDATRIAMMLAGTTGAPHFDRTAFKVIRTYATLAADGLSVNFKFTPDEQEFQSMLAPDIFVPIPNGWGRQGWTTAVLAPMSEEELEAALQMAWEHGRANARARGLFDELNWSLPKQKNRPQLSEAL